MNCIHEYRARGKVMPQAIQFLLHQTIQFLLGMECIGQVDHMTIAQKAKVHPT